MTQCEDVRVARQLLALFGEQSFIFVQDLNKNFHNIQKTPLTRSGFKTMFLRCIYKICQIWCMTAWITVKRLDVKINIWLLISVTRAQPHAPSCLSGGEHGLIPEQWLDTKPSFSWESPIFGAFSRSPSFCQNLPGFGTIQKLMFSGFSDTRGNGLINLSFVPKSKSFFDRGWWSVSFCNSFPQSSFRGPSSCPVVFQKRLLLTCLPPGPMSILQLWNHVHAWLTISEDYIANSLGGRVTVCWVCPGENLPVFKLQRLECLMTWEWDKQTFYGY